MCARVPDPDTGNHPSWMAKNKIAYVAFFPGYFLSSRWEAWWTKQRDDFDQYC